MVDVPVGDEIVCKVERLLVLVARTDPSRDAGGCGDAVGAEAHGQCQPRMLARKARTNASPSSNFFSGRYGMLFVRLDARLAPPFMEATDASRLVCVVVVSYQELRLAAFLPL